jgi:hypothetical protein
MPISQPLKAPDTDVQLDLIHTTSYVRQKHLRSATITNVGVCLFTASKPLLKGEKEMTNSEIGLLVGGILGILVGIAVIVWPRILAYMVGTYLIIVGIIAIVAAVR